MILGRQICPLPCLIRVKDRLENLVEPEVSIEPVPEEVDIRYHEELAEEEEPVVGGIGVEEASKEIEDLVVKENLVNRDDVVKLMLL